MQWPGHGDYHFAAMKASAISGAKSGAKSGGGHLAEHVARALQMRPQPQTARPQHRAVRVQLRRRRVGPLHLPAAAAAAAKSAAKSAVSVNACRGCGPLRNATQLGLGLGQPGLPTLPSTGLPAGRYADGPPSVRSGRLGVPLSGLPVHPSAPVRAWRGASIPRSGALRGMWESISAHLKRKGWQWGREDPTPT